jgi:hypothetical protein
MAEAMIDYDVGETAKKLDLKRLLAAEQAIRLAGAGKSNGFTL